MLKRVFPTNMESDMNSEDLKKSLDEIKAALSKISLISGENIVLTQTQEGLAISAKGLLSSKFKRWLLYAYDKLNQPPELRAGENILITREDSALRIHALVQAQSGAKASLPQSEASYPFKATKGTEEGSLLIMGHNEEKGRSFKSLVTLGLAVLEVPETTITGISSNCYVYLSITSTSDTYQLVFKKKESLPEQSNSEYNIPIAYVETKDGAISKISQLQYGPIQGAGRIF